MFLEEPRRLGSFTDLFIMPLEKRKKKTSATRARRILYNNNTSNSRRRFINFGNITRDVEYFPIKGEGNKIEKIANNNIDVRVGKHNRFGKIIIDHPAGGQVPAEREI